MNLTRLAPVRNLEIPILLMRERRASQVAFNPLDPAFRTDPYPTYRLLRSRDPVHWSELAHGWILTRYSDVLFALRDPRFSNHAVPAKLNERMGPILKEGDP